MSQILEGMRSFTWSISLRTPPSQGVILKRRHFQHALPPGMSKNAKRMGNNYEMENLETNQLPLINQVGPVVDPNNSESEDITSYIDPEPLFRIPRKYRMKDEYGNILPKKHKPKESASAVWLPESWNMENYMEIYSKLTLNVRSLNLGTLNMIFRGPVTISVDYIEITNNVRIEALEITSCEWYMGSRLPSLFVRMTDAAFWHLREKLSVATDTGTLDGCQSKTQENCLCMTFESVLTVPEEATLEEILTEIGKRKNLNNFLVRLACKESDDGLMAHKHSQKSEVTTLSVSDSEGGDDQMECSASNTQLAKTLVVYPPPPAKGGFSITQEDLKCLDAGQFLNDVIIDFYLKYLVCETLKEEDAKRCHVFSSFFYKSLTQNDPDSTGLSIQERRHNRVKTWTRHLDLFKKDFIFVPINQSRHWFLAVICFPGQDSHCSTTDSCEKKDEEPSVLFAHSSPFSNPMSLFYRHETFEQDSKWSPSEGELDEGFFFNSDFQYDRTSRYALEQSDASEQPCILIMDSLSCDPKPKVVKILQEYLEMEWRVRKGSSQNFGKQAMNGWSVQVPQQDNYTDCGIYVLQYVESFITNPPRVFHSTMDLRDLFPQRLVKKKREGIKRLIFRLHRQQQAEMSASWRISSK